MPSCRISPPWEFLLSASLVDQWVEENSSAMLARWLMENRERERAVVETPQPVAQPAAAPPTASDNFLGDFPAGRSNNHGRI